MEETKNIITQGNGVTPILRLYDRNTPIVVLFGPQASGKKSVLFSLTSHLESTGYIIRPVYSLFSSTDRSYSRACDRFKEMAYSTYTDSRYKGFLFVDILRRDGRKICQLLVLPGQYCYEPGCYPNTLSACIKQIICSPNRKIWIPFVEADWATPDIRSRYVQQIGKLKTSVSPRDNFIIMVNKVDRLDSVFHGHIDFQNIKKYVFPQYSGLLDMFRVISLVRFNRPYNCDFVPFSSGTFSEHEGREIWLKGYPLYPNMLWKVINKCVK